MVSPVFVDVAVVVVVVVAVVGFLVEANDGLEGISWLDVLVFFMGLMVVGALLVRMVQT